MPSKDQLKFEKVYDPNRNKQLYQKQLTDKLFLSLDEVLNAFPSETAGDEVWAEQPAPLEEWLYSPNFLALDVRLSKIQFEFIEAMDDINPETNQITTIIGEWGKGAGKDFTSAIACLRQVYLLLCLRNTYSYFGLAKNSGIQLANTAYTADQAKYVFFKQLKSIVNNSPWFNKQNPTIMSSRIKFDREIELVSTSTDGDSIEGQNLFFAVMDEASAFRDAGTVKAMRRMDGVKVDRAADAIYDVLRTSTESRFPSTGKVVMISYPRYQDDFIQTMRKKFADNPNAFVSGPYATWDVNPGKTRENFDKAYRENPEKAAAMYECKPPFAEDGYIKYPLRFITCVVNSKKLGLASPIDSAGMYDPYFQGLPGRFYSIHVDLALKKDRCALALARQGEPVSRIKCPCNRFNFRDAEVCDKCGTPKARWIKSDLPTCVVTLLKEFKPQITGGVFEVDFSDVRDEIIWIMSRGHKLWALSYDGWQSVDSIQTMRKILGKRPVKDRWGKVTREEDIAAVLSVDRNTEAHDTLKEMIYDERFFICPPADIREKEDWETSEDPVAIAYREWRKLRVINAKKIDHPMGGGKDFADALAGAAYWTSKMPIARLHRSKLGGWTEQYHKPRSA